MSKTIKTTIAAALVAAIALPSFAEEAAPVLDTGSDWTGAHIGLQLGYGETTGAAKGDNSFGGLAAGYDWDLGDWVVGVGADVNFTGLETKAGDIDTLTRLKLRGGYDFGDALLYATAGASYAASSDFDNDWGYFGGVGLEYRVSDTVSLTGELVTHRFDSFHDGKSLNANTAIIGINYRF